MFRTWDLGDGWTWRFLAPVFDEEWGLSNHVRVWPRSLEGGEGRGMLSWGLMSMDVQTRMPGILLGLRQQSCVGIWHGLHP